MRIYTGHIVAIFSAAFLFAFSMAVEAPSLILLDAQHMLASVGVSAAVEQNPYNAVAEQLSMKENKLNAQQAALDEREKQLAQRENSPLGLVGVFSMSTSILLAAALAINFYLDYRRQKRASTSYAVSLK